MAEMRCPQCGAPVEAGSTTCRYCGSAINTQQFSQQQNQQNQQQAYQQAYQQGYQQGFQQQYQQGYQQPYYDPRANWPIKSKLAAGLLAIFLGDLGIHKFYLGQVGKGVLYLVFCWTGIPAIIGLIEGIVYLCESDENFSIKNKVRVEG